MVLYYFEAISRDEMTEWESVAKTSLKCRQALLRGLFIIQEFQNSTSAGLVLVEKVGCALRV
ncbi:hypothetical protein HMPREF3289_22555 [Pseudomonas sp. HMSC75E02]|nr:hypothetical protein HMPREF3289_22555 [Pseudomonas sp. HMSC75E02]